MDEDVNVIERVDAARTHALRRAVLRPHQALDEMVFEGDDAPEAAHFIARRGGPVVGVASVLPAVPSAGLEPLATAFADVAGRMQLPGDWRVRGMATDPALRRQGVGAALLRACAAHAASRGGTALWCHARVSARPFYVSQGFTQLGASFELPQIGPHVFMWRAL